MEPRRISFTYFHLPQVIRQFLSTGIGDIGAKCLLFVAFVYLARTLSVTRFGELSFALAVVTLLSPVVEFGLGYLGTREVARAPETLSSSVGSIVVARLFLAGLAVAGAVVFVLSTSLSLDTNLLIILFSLSFFLQACTVTWAYQAVKKPEWFVAEKLIQATLYVIAVIAVIHGDKDLLLLPMLAFLSLAISLVVVVRGFLPSRDVHNPAGSFSNFIKTHSRSAFSLFSVSLLNQAHLSIDLILAGFFLSSEQVGQLGAAFRIIVVLIILPNLIWSSFYPALSQHGPDGQRAMETARLLLRYLFVGGIPFIGISLAFSRDIVLTLFGSRYLDAVVPLKLGLLAMALMFVSIGTTRILPSINQERRYLHIVGAAAVIHLALSVVLIPFWGIVGAALSFLITEGFLASAGIVVLKNAVRSELLRTITFSAAATILGIGLVHALTWILHLGFLFSTGLFILTYVLMISVSKLVPMRELAQLEQSMEGRT